MNRSRIVGAVVAALAVLALCVTTAVAHATPPRRLAAAAAVSQADALAAADTASAYIAAHPDATAGTQDFASDGIAAGKAYIQSHPDVTATSTPTPTGTAFPSNVTATPASGQITLAWAAPTSGSPTGYIYGRNGVDTTGYGAWTSSVQPLTLHSVVLDKLVNGTPYQVFVEAVYGTGNQRVTLTATPGTVVTPTTTTTPPTSTTTTSAVPTTTTTTTSTSSRLSGLPWSSGVWTDQDPNATANFVTTARGGRNVDNILVYTSRNSVATENSPTSWRAALPASFNGVTQDLVLGLTSWTSDGAFMTGAQGAQIGTSLCSVDGTHPIVRLDWEMNLPDGAGSNGAALTSSNYTAWVARFRAVATGVKSTCPSALIDFNPNVGADQTSGCNSGTYAAPNNCSRRAFQAVKDVVDIFGLDTYDSWPPVTSSGSGWSARSNGASFGSLENSRLYAVANGKKFSVPEWGVACNVSNCQWQGNAGGDDPTYIHDMLGYFVAHAGDMAYDTYFNDPNSYIISDLISNNPNSRAQYKADILANVS